MQNFSSTRYQNNSVLVCCKTFNNPSTLHSAHILLPFIPPDRLKWKMNRHILLLPIDLCYVESLISSSDGIRGVSAHLTEWHEALSSITTPLVSMTTSSLLTGLWSSSKWAPWRIHCHTWNIKTSNPKQSEPSINQ